jgi:hypothetical protein
MMLKLEYALDARVTPESIVLSVLEDVEAPKEILRR